MATPTTPKELDSIISIDKELYLVKAAKVDNKLTIKTLKDGVEATIEYDGSEPQTIEVGDAKKIQVNLDEGQKAQATITVSKEEPTGGNIGDIWFKY